MTIHKDAIGQTIHVGDSVLWLDSTSYAGSIVYKVGSTTPKRVRLVVESDIDRYTHMLADKDSGTSKPLREQWLYYAKQGTAVPPKNVVVVTQNLEGLRNEAG